jgi:hypothetical protein
MSNINKPHSRFLHVYAIVRIDLPIDQDYPENTLAVVKVFPSQLDGKRELSRLNKLNQDKNCKYILTITRLVP